MPSIPTDPLADTADGQGRSPPRGRPGDAATAVFGSLQRPPILTAGLGGAHVRVADLGEPR